MELHKRKAVESSQTAADLKLHLDKYQAQLKEAQVAVAEKTGAIEQEAYKYKRMQVIGQKNWFSLMNITDRSGPIFFP